MAIQNYAFGPKTLTVPAGTSITWTNGDAVIRTATADDQSWDSSISASWGSD